MDNSHGAESSPEAGNVPWPGPGKTSKAGSNREDITGDHGPMAITLGQPGPPLEGERPKEGKCHTQICLGSKWQSGWDARPVVWGSWKPGLATVFPILALVSHRCRCLVRAGRAPGH